MFGVLGQELPPVVNFEPNQYAGGNQNWMIAQAENKNLYFANSTGLLEYNGEEWQLYPVPNNTIVRSVKVIGDRIYTGAYMEVGYWLKNENGTLDYTSLIPEFSGGIGDGEQFWEIEFLDGLVIFRSFGGVYFYDPQEETITKMENPLGKPISGIFKLEGELYFQLVGEGLYKIVNGVPQIVIPFSILRDTAIMHVYLEDGVLSILTGRTEFLKWENGNLKKVIKPVNIEFGNPVILDAVNTPNGHIILGTVGKGILEIDANGDILNLFNQGNVLLNNTVLDLFIDKENNLWAGLDYGLSMIDLDSNFKSFQDNRGQIGSVYDSFEKEGELYLGTNQGLYWRKNEENNFQLIEETNGQVWYIDEINGAIICGQDSGTFLIENGSASKVCDRLGTWLVRKYKDDVWIQGHYNGISFLKSQNGTLEALPMLPNFPHSSKFIEIDNDLNVWISNEHQGVFKIQLNDSLNGILKIENYKFQDESGITSSLFKFNDTIYYSSKDKIYQFNSTQNKFTPDNQLNTLVSDLDLISGRIIKEKDKERLWGFAKDGIFYIENARLSKNYVKEFIYIDQSFRNIALGYENISDLGNSDYLLGVANGYFRFSEVDNLIDNLKIQLNRIEVSALDKPAKKVELNEAAEFDFSRNNISFSFTAPVYNKYNEVHYSYRLLGLSENWNEWSTTSQAIFNNLNFGDYKFEVKARVGNAITESVSYNFSIARPFYLSTLAIIGYFIIFLLLLFLVHILNRRHHRKYLAEAERDLKMRNLEAEQEIIQLRNEKLEQEMANKNRELAVSTMSLIRKNEFLTSIKEKLKDSESSVKVKSVIKTIDKDISEEDNWKFFKKAFSNADKDFFQKIKEKHPELTSNDLKLCAYLRLNLSSKEIAPLLNISVKSVEIKRYRLRKKMDLERETNLTDYILAL